MIHGPDAKKFLTDTAGQVPRTKLIQKIKAVSSGRHVYIAAPAGYGKTIAVTQWLATVRGNKVKLIAGSADNVPGFFYRRIAAALLKLVGRPNPVPDVAITFDRLLEAVDKLPAKGKRCYFIIDDIHTIKNEEITKRLPILFARIPGYVCCCVISQNELLLPLAENGLFGMVGKESLAFSTDEIEWLGMEKGIELRPEQTEKLREKTGGWIMYLLALLSSSSFDDDIVTAESHPALMHYIETRVWGRVPQETKVLLVSLAVPGVITPELCRRLLGRSDAERFLRKMSMDENSFLRLTTNDNAGAEDIYYFHDVFREFLLSRAGQILSENEIRRLNDVAGNWHYERGEYYEGARHFIRNRDHGGITRCFSESLNYLRENAHISVEVRFNFAKQHLLDLPDDFIMENAYLIVWRAAAAFHGGDAAGFCKYVDILYGGFPEISARYPELLQTVLFVFSLDFRTSLREQCARIESYSARRTRTNHSTPATARISSVTQNLPFFHRSMRDYSELFALSGDSINLIRSVYGNAISNEYKVMEPLLVAGLYHERGEMIDAMRYAMIGYGGCTEDMHPEIRFCSQMILAAIFHAIGAKREAALLMNWTKDYIESEARFLAVNFKAVNTIWAVRGGDKDAAREWMDADAYRSSGNLPFYQLCRHFATLLSLIALENYDEAVSFGRRLQTLADDYRRPLDRIESRLMTAAALRGCGDAAQSNECFREALSIAQPYGFVQSFVNEGREILPMLREMRRRKDTPREQKKFADTLIEAVCERYLMKSDKVTAPKISKRQRDLLAHIDRGLSYTEIAEKTGIRRATVKYHLLTAYKKIGVNSGSEAVMRAKELGIL